MPYHVDRESGLLMRSGGTKRALAADAEADARARAKNSALVTVALAIVVGLIGLLLSGCVNAKVHDAAVRHRKNLAVFRRAVQPRSYDAKARAEVDQLGEALDATAAEIVSLTR